MYTSEDRFVLGQLASASRKVGASVSTPITHGQRIAIQKVMRRYNKALKGELKPLVPKSEDLV